jgi:hypothetical protein
MMMMMMMMIMMMIMMTTTTTSYCCVVWEALTLLQIWSIDCSEGSRVVPARPSGKDRLKQSKVLGK